MRRAARKKACVPCRESHTACDGSFPCKRCQATGQGHRCQIAPPRARERSNGVVWKFQPDPRTRTVTNGPSGSDASAPHPNPVDQPPVKRPRLEHVPVVEPVYVAPTPPASLPHGAPPTAVSAGWRALSPSMMPSAVPYPLPPLPTASTPSAAPPTSFGSPLPYAASTPPTAMTTASPPGSTVEDKVRTVESIVGLLVEELRSVRNDNKLLRSEITSMRSQHQQTEAHIMRMAENHVAPATSSSPYGGSDDAVVSSSSSSSAVWLPPSSPTFGLSNTDAGDPTTPEARALMRRLMPFITKYEGRTPNMPLVIDDMNKPWAAFRTNEPKTVRDLEPPTLLYANPSFCALLRYRLDELLGCGLNNIVRVDMETFFTIMPSLFPQRKAFTVGDPFKASVTWITKDKRAVYARTRNQYFFSKDGYAKWRIIVVDGLIEDSPRFAPLSMPEVYRYLGIWTNDAQPWQPLPHDDTPPHDSDSPGATPPTSYDPSMSPLTNASPSSSSSSSSPAQPTLAADQNGTEKCFFTMLQDATASQFLQPIDGTQPSPSADLLEEWLDVF